MPSKSMPTLFVVDGSNIATEGRSVPSLEQLNDAVLAFMAERPDVLITVVVDATFGHRIDKREAEAFDEAVANNELVTPPAGAVGRGDAFVLSIANKANAGILSNDSFQEFHGEYDWLFDEGRLVGGKPVPHVGWVFVTRTPVRGPKSRQSVREAKVDATETKQRANRRIKPKSSAADSAAEPVEEPSAAEPASKSSRGRGRRRGKAAETAPPASESAVVDASASSDAASPSSSQVNDLMPFLEFAERHPVGTSCTGVVESYASHGAYVRVDDVLVYVPLRLMDDPVPRSARSVLTVGDAVSVVIVGYVGDRRSIDAALPHMSGGALADAASSEGGAPVAAVQPTNRRSRSRRTAEPASGTGDESVTPAKKAAAKKAPARKAPAKKAPAKKTTAAKAPAKKAPAKKTTAAKAPAKTAPAKKAAARKTTAAKTPAKKAPAKKTTAAKAPAKKTAAKKAPAKKSTAAKKASAKKAAAPKASGS